MISRIVFIILFSLISLNLYAKQTAFDLSGEKIKIKISDEYQLYFPQEFDLFFTYPLKSTA